MGSTMATCSPRRGGKRKPALERYGLTNFHGMVRQPHRPSNPNTFTLLPRAPSRLPCNFPASANGGPFSGRAPVMVARAAGHPPNWDTIKHGELKRKACVVDRCTIGVTSTHTCHGRDMPSAAAAHPPGLHFLYLTLYGAITGKAIRGPRRTHQSSPGQTLAPGLSPRAQRTGTAIYNSQTVPGTCVCDWHFDNAQLVQFWFPSVWR